MAKIIICPEKVIGEPQPHLHRLAWWFILGVVGAVVVGIGILVASLTSHTFNIGSGNQAPDRVFVVIVPGTYGNDAFWPNVVDGKATFASELRSVLERGSEIYPFLWASSVYHAKRLEAAQNLAELIDRRAAEFDRVCLVGHSHGGNVALMAAALCQKRVDTIVCLSTPHPYLRTVGQDGQNCFLPIYCSAKTCENVDHIITVSPNTDSVPGEWSNETMTGLSENEAIRLTTGWREALNHPRLANDSFAFRLFESGNIVAFKHLPPIHDETTKKEILNCSVLSFVQGVIEPHSCIHSRRMGRVVGELLRDRADPRQVDYLRRMVQPEGEDVGEPISLDEHKRIISCLGHKYEHAGWLLERIAVQLHPKAAEVAEKGKPDPYVRVTSSTDNALDMQTESQSGTLEATWAPAWFIPEGTKVVLAVWDANLFFSDTYLGGWQLASTCDLPPERFEADIAKAVYWSASLKWLSFHY
jgi:pimeloyl-ACP methyl ester carboxylesterase